MSIIVNFFGGRVFGLTRDIYIKVLYGKNMPFM